MGVPVGSDLDYADEVTMHKAMEGRREVQSETTFSTKIARRPRPRHSGRTLPRRAGARAQVGGGRLRQAAADDGPALRHGLDHRRALGRLDVAREARRLARRRGAGHPAGLWAVAFAIAFLFPLVFPGADCDLLQHHAPRTPAAIRLRRASTSRRIRSTRWPTTSCPRSSCFPSSSAWRSLASSARRSFSTCSAWSATRSRAPRGSSCS